MEREVFYKLQSARVAERMKLLEEKGRAYAGTGDVFGNFKRNADDLSLTKFQVWAVYAFKHFDSIKNAIKQNPSFPVDKSEGMQSRIDDAINYLDLLSAMLQENTNETDAELYETVTINGSLDPDLIVAPSIEWSIPGGSWNKLIHASYRRHLPTNAVFRKRKT